MYDHLGAQSGVTGDGIDTDYILYVSAVNSTTCLSAVMAYASHCQLEPDFDRFVVIFTVNTIHRDCTDVLRLGISFLGCV